MGAYRLTAKNLRTLLLQALILFCFVMIVLSFAEKAQTKTAVSIHGFVNLENADFDHNIYEITGDWHLAANEHRYTRDSDPLTKIPMLWKPNQMNQLSISTQLRLNDSNDLLALRLGNIRMAYELYADQKLIAKSGQLGTESSRAISYNVPKVVTFKPESASVTLTLIIDNDYYNSIGIVEPILIGQPDRMVQRQIQLNTLDLIITVGFFLSAVYFLVLYFTYPADRTQFYFALYSLLYGFIVMSGYQKVLLQLYPFIPFEETIFVRLVANELALFLICLYYNLLHPKLISTKLVVGLGIVQITQIILYLVLEPLDYWQLDSVFFSGQLFILAYIGYRMILFVRKNITINGGTAEVGYNLDLVILIAMYLCLFSNHFVYMLYNLGLIDNQSSGFAFLSVFLFLNIRLVAIKYLLAHEEISSVNFELQRALENRDKFMLQTAQDLISPLENIKTLAIATESYKEKDLESSIQEIYTAANQLSFEIRSVIDQDNMKFTQPQIDLYPVHLLSLLKYCILLYQNKGETLIPLINFGQYKNTYVLGDESKLVQAFLHLMIHQGKTSAQISISVEQVDLMIISLKFEDFQLQQVPASHKRRATDETAFNDSKDNLPVDLSIAVYLLEQMKGSLITGKESLAGHRTYYLHLMLAPLSDIRDQFLTDKDYIPAPMPYSLNGNDNEPLKQTILIVHQSDKTIQPLIQKLKKNRYRIINAKTGIEALECMDLLKPDLMILDSTLIDMSGIELCQAVRRTYNTTQLPVILMLFKHYDSEINLGIQAGMNDYFVKPLNLNECLLKVEVVLKFKSISEDLIHAEVAFWQSQIKPHFIYNALNVITSLIYQDQEYAAELLSEFGNYLRMSIDLDLKEMLLPIEKELSLIRSYVAIEKARFGDRLAIDYHVEEKLYTVCLPALLIQPLVENAVKHGVLKRISGGTVKIMIKQLSNDLFVSIKDDGVGMENEVLANLLKDGNGNSSVGVKNVHRRLKAIYGSRLNIKSKLNEGTLVWFKIPMIDLGGEHENLNRR